MNLEAESSFFRELYEKNPIPMWVYDRETFRFLIVNAAAIKNYGYSEEEFKRLTILDIRPKHLVAGMEEKLRKPRGTVRVISQHLKKCGEIIDVQVQAQDFRFCGKRGRLVVAQDITAQVTAENNRKTFISLLSHDLRNPLTAAHASAELLLRTPGITEKMKLLASRIVEDMNRADRMIRDLLDADKIGSGRKLMLKIGPCDLYALVKATLAELTLIHGERFQFKANHEPIQFSGYWCMESLRRALENLCSNAVKYGDAKARIRIHLKRDPKGVRLSVNNRGAPLTPVDRHNLFKLYERTGRAQRSDARGWGLGLTLVKGVVDSHGGHIEVKSTEKTGTTFTILLPIDTRMSAG